MAINASCAVARMVRFFSSRALISSSTFLGGGDIPQDNHAASEVALVVFERLSIDADPDRLRKMGIAENEFLPHDRFAPHRPRPTADSQEKSKADCPRRTSFGRRFRSSRKIRTNPGASHPPVPGRRCGGRPGFQSEEFPVVVGDDHAVSPCYPRRIAGCGFAGGDPFGPG